MLTPGSAAKTRTACSVSNMSTGGSINDKALAISILDHARDAISAQHNRIHDGAGVVIPTHDTELSYAGVLL